MPAPKFFPASWQMVGQTTDSAGLSICGVFASESIHFAETFWTSLAACGSV